MPGTPQRPVDGAGGAGGLRLDERQLSQGDARAVGLLTVPAPSHRPFRTRFVAGLLAVGVAVAGCSSDDDAEDAAEGGADDGAELAFFDSSALHEISMSFDEADYEAMIEAFTDTGEKEWIEATVSIDGVTYEQVGLRLKGNSSLGGLGGGFGPSSAEEPERVGGPGGSASADEPEGLPWLIRLDKFVDDQSHQGHEEIVVRSNNSATSLNEAVALELLDEAGLASQEASATSFSVNGSDAVLRLTIEHPDEVWNEATFDSEGALYKAESSGGWSYRGDDPEDYDDVFNQKAGEDVTDLAPVIELLDFVNNSDDEVFAAELSERLDVEALATYLAMMDLIGNFDDISGPGNNGYLRYDVESDMFTVVPWDMNLAFDGGLGGGFPGGGEGGGPPEDFELPEGSGPSEGFEPPEGFEQPEGFEPSEDLELPEELDSGSSPGGGAGFGGRSNPLVERFHATPELEALYQEQLTELRSSLYESGAADDILAEWVTVLSEDATDLVDEATITEEAESIAEQFSTE